MINLTFHLVVLLQHRRQSSRIQNLRFGFVQLLMHLFL